MNPVIEQGGHAFSLLPERAVWWPAADTLLVADLHLGKSADFRLRGIPVPEGDSLETLERLGQLVKHRKAARVLILGDLFHGPAANLPEVQSLFRSWLADFEDTRFQLIPGNHDRHAPGLAEALGIELLETHHQCHGHQFHHVPPEPNTSASAFAGHLHPAVRLKGDGGPALRIPCFYRHQSLLLLPAFGSFTGQATIAPAPGSEVWGLVDSRVLFIPRSLCRSV